MNDRSWFKIGSKSERTAAEEGWGNLSGDELEVLGLERTTAKEVSCSSLNDKS